MSIVTQGLGTGDTIVTKGYGGGQAVSPPIPSPGGVGGGFGLPFLPFEEPEVQEFKKVWEIVGEVREVTATVRQKQLIKFLLLHDITGKIRDNLSYQYEISAKLRDSLEYNKLISGRISENYSSGISIYGEQLLNIKSVLDFIRNNNIKRLKDLKRLRRWKTSRK